MLRDFLHLFIYYAFCVQRPPHMEQYKIVTKLQLLHAQDVQTCTAAKQCRTWSSTKWLFDFERVLSNQEMESIQLKVWLSFGTKLN